MSSALNNIVKSLGNGATARGGGTMRRRSNFKRSNRNRNTSRIVIPPYSPSISLTKRFRFAEALGEPFDSAITVPDLLQLLSIQAGTPGTNNYLVSLLSSIRVLKTTVYGPPGQNLEPVTVTVEYVAPTNSFGGRSKIHSGISMGSLGCSVTAVPDPFTFAGMWLNDPDENDVVMNLSGPPGGIIDLTVEFTLQDNQAVAPYYVATNSVTPLRGRMFIAPLDGILGNQLLPVDYQTS